MRIELRYFAALREALGAADSLDVAAGTTVAALRELLVARSPRHAAALARPRALRCALDQQLCSEDAVLHEGAEVAFFPPVTGG